jgi:hypothetical protein
LLMRDAANQRRANNSRGLQAAKFAAMRRFLPFRGYPSPTKSIFTFFLHRSQHSGWYQQTQEWLGYRVVQEASAVIWVWARKNRLKSKNTQKHVVGGGFSPKTRGRIVLTLIRFGYSWSLIFCRNLHTKIIPLTPREPRNTLFSMATGTINKRRMVGHVDPYGWAMFVTTFYHQPVGYNRFLTAPSVER